MDSQLVFLNPETDAILDVDVQTTFMPGGGLPVTGGDEIVPTVIRNRKRFPREHRFGTVDRHKKGSVSLHTSFRDLVPCAMVSYHDYTAGRLVLADIAKFTLEQFGEYLQQVGSVVLWPEHGLEGTPEGELHPSLSLADYAYVLVKGLDVLCDSYSGFKDNLGRSTGLGDILRTAGIKRIFMQGLAFDFCVGFSALDARAEGFEVVVLEDATRSVNLPGSVKSMRTRLLAGGVHIAQSSDLRAAA